MSARIANPDDEAPAPDGVRIPAALSEAIAYGLRLAQEASFAAYLQRVGNPDLKPGRYTVLMLLADNPGLTPTALSRSSGRDKSTLTNTLRDLEARGYVVRSRNAGDRRSYAVSLTPVGCDLLDQLRRHAEAHDAMLDRVVGADKARLMSILGRITRALGDGDEQLVTVPTAER